jgi:hypothetical protein
MHSIRVLYLHPALVCSHHPRGEQRDPHLLVLALEGAAAGHSLRVGVLAKSAGREELVDGIQVHKVITASKSKPSTVWI